MATTRERILETALCLFNESGVSRVGVREISRALELSPGNLAYHFPTKDALVATLVNELHELNAKTVFAALPEDFSPVDLYRSAIAAMENSLRYRFVLLGYVDAVRGSPELGRVEAKLAIKRRARHDEMIRRLAENGYVDRRRHRRRAEILYEQGQILSSGWLAAAMLRTDRRDDREVVRHYAKLGVALLEPYSTENGARLIERILRGELDAR